RGGAAHRDGNKAVIRTSRRIDSPMTIDTHIHLYDTQRPQGVPFPKPEDRLIFRPMLPADLRQGAEPAGVGGGRREPARGSRTTTGCSISWRTSRSSALWLAT